MILCLPLEHMKVRLLCQVGYQLVKQNFSGNKKTEYILKKTPISLKTLMLLKGPIYMPKNHIAQTDRSAYETTKKSSY